MALVSLGLASSPLLAQPPGLRDIVEVELVLVDALVTDRTGRAVLDLTRDEFRLFEDGEPVEISHFSMPTASEVGPGQSGETDRVPTLPTPALPRAEAERLIIFLDQLHLKPISRIRALQQLAGVLDAHLSERTEVMVASFDGTVQIVLPPTRDRKRLWEALTEQARYGSRALAVDFEGRQIIHDLRQMLEVEIEVSRGCDLESVCATPPVSSTRLPGAAPSTRCRSAAPAASRGPATRGRSAR